jgi:transcriptional regulator with XRE-family HTH domain
MVLGKRIRTTREARGLPREELARRVDLTLGQMANVERGKSALPRIPTLKKILQELDLQGYVMIDVAGYGSGEPAKAIYFVPATTPLQTLLTETPLLKQRSANTG